MNLLASLFEKSPWSLVLGLVALFGVSSWGLSRLSFDDEPRGVFSADDEDFHRLEDVLSDFGSDDNDCVFVMEADDWFLWESIETLRDLIGRCREVQGIESVHSLDDLRVFRGNALPESLLPKFEDRALLESARLEASQHPLVQGHLLSPDGRTALVIVRLKGGSLPVAQIAPITDELKKIASDLSESSGMRIRLTGIPEIRVEIYAGLRDEQIRLSTLGALVSIVIAILLFRRVVPVAMATIAAVSASLTALGFFGVTDTPINILNITIPTLVLVVAFTDAVHLVMAVRRFRSEGMAPKDAAIHAIKRLGPACALTSATTAIGFASLITTGVHSIQQFGSQAALSILLSFCVVVTIVPLLSVLWGRGDWHLFRSWETKSQRFFDRYSLFVTSHSGWVSGIGITATLALALIALELRPENKLGEALPHSSDANLALLHADEMFGGLQTMAVLVEWPESESWNDPHIMAAVEKTQLSLSKPDIFSHSLSYLDLLKLVPGDETRARIRMGLIPEDLRGRFLHESRHRALIIARVPDAGSMVLDTALEQLKGDLAALTTEYPDLEFHVTGTSYVARKNLVRMIEGLAAGLALAGLVIFASLAAVFRSWRLGVISTVPNALPLVVAGAALVLVNAPLQISSAMVFTICLGIAVDDTIHFLARFRKDFRVHGDVAMAIQASMRAVGPTLIVTTLALISGFAIIFFSRVAPLKSFSVLACLGMAAALVGDLLLLPALLIRFYKVKGTQESHPEEPTPSLPESP